MRTLLPARLRSALIVSALSTCLLSWLPAGARPSGERAVGARDDRSLAAVPLRVAGVDVRRVIRRSDAPAAAIAPADGVVEPAGVEPAGVEPAGGDPQATTDDPTAWALGLAGVEAGPDVQPDHLVAAKESLGVPVGERVDEGDVERIVVAAHQTAARTLEAVGVPVGPTVQPDEIVAAKRALGIPVGERVDPGDAARVIAEAAARVAPEQLAAPARQLAARRTVDPQPVFATVAGVELRLPSESVALVGFHQSALPGVLGLRPAPRGGMTTLASRGRPTHPRSAADISMPAGRPVASPVTGRVVEVTRYPLYGRVADVRIRIVPDANPDVVVSVLHVRDPLVAVDSTVEGGRTVVAGSANPLPFASQIDSLAGRLPHVHIEVRPR